jgi:hypothetical protein
MKMIYYSLFEPRENNQIGTIAIENMDQLKPMIEQACKHYFDEECIVNLEDLDKLLPYFKKCPTITFDISLPDNDGKTKVEMAETWIYTPKDL